MPLDPDYRQHVIPQPKRTEFMSVRAYRNGGWHPTIFRRSAITRYDVPTENMNGCIFGPDYHAVDVHKDDGEAVRVWLLM